jgi:AcrR family transcriptional regulator
MLEHRKYAVKKKDPGTVFGEFLMNVRSETRRTAILEQAIELFQEKGYERASMNELVRRCGGSKQTIYSYFPSKEALFTAVIKDVATRHMPEAVAEIRSQESERLDLEARLIQFGERMMSVLTNDAGPMAIYRMVVAESGHSTVGQLFYESGPAQLVEAVAEFFENAIERGELRPLNPRALAEQFTALLTAENSHRLYMLDPAPMTHDAIHQMIRRAVDIFLFGAAISSSFKQS